MRQPGGGLAAVLLVQLARAQITTTYVADLVCTRDDVYSSLSREGREFCESVLGDSCESVSKPGSYSSLADEEISSYCECVLTEYPTSTQTGSAAVNGTSDLFPSATGSSPSVTAPWSNGTVYSTVSSTGPPASSISTISGSGQTSYTRSDGYNSTTGAAASPSQSLSSGEVPTGWNSTASASSTSPGGAGTNSTITGSDITSSSSGTDASSEAGTGTSLAEGTVATGAETTSGTSAVNGTTTRFPNSTSETGSALTSSTGPIALTNSTVFSNLTTATSPPAGTTSGFSSGPVATTSATGSPVSQGTAQSSGISNVPSGSASGSWNNTASPEATTSPGLSGTGGGALSTGSGGSWSGRPTYSRSSSFFNETDGGFTVQPTSATNSNLSSLTTPALSSGPSGSILSSSGSQVPWPVNSTSSTTRLPPGSVTILPIPPFPTGTGIPVPSIPGSGFSFTGTVDTTSGSWNSTGGVGGGFTWTGESNSTSLSLPSGSSASTTDFSASITTDGGTWTGPWNSTLTSTPGGASQGSGVASTGSPTGPSANSTGAAATRSSTRTQISLTLPTLTQSPTSVSAGASDGVNSSFTGWNSSLSTPSGIGSGASGTGSTTSSWTTPTGESSRTSTGSLSPTGTAGPWTTPNQTSIFGTYTSSATRSSLTVTSGSPGSPISSEGTIFSTTNATSTQGANASETSTTIFTRTDGSTSIPIGTESPWTLTKPANETFTWGTYSTSPSSNLFTRTDGSTSVPIGTEAPWTLSSGTGNGSFTWGTYSSTPSTNIFTRTDGSTSVPIGTEAPWTLSRTDTANSSFTWGTYSSTTGTDSVTSATGGSTSNPIGSESSWTLSRTGNETFTFGTYTSKPSSSPSDSGVGSVQVTSPSASGTPASTSAGTTTTTPGTSSTDTSATDASETGPYSFGNSSAPTRSYISATPTWPGTNTTTPTPTPTPIPAENFTDVARAGALKQDHCYQLPRTLLNDFSPPYRNRALLRNSKVLEANGTLPVPYIESIDFEDDGVLPLFMTVRDGEDGTYYIDISNHSRLAIVDSVGNSMVLDNSGVYFATNSCRFDVNVTIANLFSQVANLSETDCSFGDGQRPPDTFRMQKADDIQFDQTLYLRDQCGTPVTRAIREYPELKVGDTRCQDTAIDEAAGRWDFDCTFPGVLSGVLQCQKSVSDNIVNLLTKDPFGGACPDLPSMMSVLANTSSDIISRGSLQTELENQDGDEEDLFLAESVVPQYQRLWESLQGFFISNTTTNGTETNGTETNGTDDSPWETYFAAYNSRRSLINDICEDLHAGEIPLNLSLRAGASFFPSIATLNWAPSAPRRQYNITVQDPTATACCPGGGSIAETDDNETCSYPPEAFVRDTNCICGRAASGGGLAFEAAECENYEGACEVDEDCEGAFVCLTGTCCGEGGGVCVDPYACSQNGTELVTFGEKPILISW